MLVDEAPGWGALGPDGINLYQGREFCGRPSFGDEVNARLRMATGRWASW